LKVECYGASRPQSNRPGNEDAFLIIRENFVIAAVCDGAGDAQRAAQKALRQFQLLVQAASPDQILNPDIWKGWCRILDSALLGPSESTFLAAAVFGSQALVTCVGDSRAYLIGAERGVKMLTNSSTKFRLGSGKVKPFFINLSLNLRDVLLLMTDGAWTPLSLFLLERIVRGAFSRHFSDLPGVILDAAGKTGRWDDMTVVALRVISR
jgi:serine/threonine protein phosphatase PrpC